MHQILVRRRNGNGRGAIRPTSGPIDEGFASPADGPLLLTAGEVAQLLNVSERSVWRLRAAGHLPKEVEILSSTRWRRSDIDAWVADGCPNPENKR